LPLFLAGGLNPGNVTAAVVDLQPFGVDVSGGVETAVKGKKDHQKMIDFVKAVERAEEG